MVDAVLAGPDGQPAIEAGTGTPLTMEELLRRRGFVAAQGGNMHLPFMNGASAAGQTATAPTTPSSDAARALAASRGGGVAPNSAPVAAPAVDPTQQQVPVDANTGQPIAASTGMGTVDPNTLMSAAAGAVSAPAAYLAAKALLNRVGSRKAPTGAGPDARGFGADNVPAPRPGGMANGSDSRALTGVMQNRARTNSPKRLTAPNIPEADWREVQALPSAAARALSRVVR